MAGPPSDIGASELFLRLQELPRPTELVDFPANNADGTPVGQVAIRVLTQEENFICSAAAESFTRTTLKAEAGGSIPGKDEAQQGYIDIYRNAVGIELVLKFCRDAKDPNKPVFYTKEQVRRTLSNDQIGVLINYYMITKTRLGPIVADLSEAEMDAWLARLKEGGAAFPLGLLSSETRDALLMHSVSLLFNSPTDTSSSGSPAPESLPTPE